LSQKVVAIDGPSGSGKSTVAKLVAKELDFLYIDTGAMFRALGLHFDSLGKDLSDPNLISDAISQDEFNFEYGGTDSLVKINNKDLTEKIRQHHVSNLASQISQNTKVRQYLMNFQRDLISQGYCVMEGRDIGTVVFPDSFCKIFVTASSKIRAQRRTSELESRGETVQLEQVLADIEKRDHEDMSREIAPLKQAYDAVLLDTSKMSMDEVIKEIIKIIEMKKGN
jgi:cytidylate kinase